MKTTQDICPSCKLIQYSTMDKNYLRLFPQCWSCDKQDWENGNLSIEEFEKREQIAVSNTVN